VHENDFLWVALYTDLRISDVTPPAGWKLSTDRPNVSMDFHCWWFYKIATASEPAVHLFNMPEKSPAIAMAAVAYSGVDTAAPFDRATAFDTHGTPCLAPAIQATMPSGLLFVASFLSDTAFQWMPMDPMAERAKYEGVYVADYPQTAAGGSVEKRVGCTPSGDGAVMVMGLRPARP
jgi:hypothetical protein